MIRNSTSRPPPPDFRPASASAPSPLLYCRAAVQIVNAWKADRTVAAVVLSERLGSLAASLAGWKSARVAQDDVVWKPPGSGPVAYHQDSAYISRQFVPVIIYCPLVWVLVKFTLYSHHPVWYVFAV